MWVYVFNLIGDVGCCYVSKSVIYLLLAYISCINLVRFLGMNCDIDSMTLLRGHAEIVGCVVGGRRCEGRRCGFEDGVISISPGCTYNLIPYISSPQESIAQPNARIPGPSKNAVLDAEPYILPSA